MAFARRLAQEQIGRRRRREEMPNEAGPRCDYHTVLFEAPRSRTARRPTKALAHSRGGIAAGNPDRCRDGGDQNDEPIARTALPERELIARARTSGRRSSSARTSEASSSPGRRAPIRTPVDLLPTSGTRPRMTPCSYRQRRYSTTAHPQTSPPIGDGGACMPGAGSARQNRHPGPSRCSVGSLRLGAGSQREQGEP